MKDLAKLTTVFFFAVAVFASTLEMSVENSATRENSEHVRNTALNTKKSRMLTLNRTENRRYSSDALWAPAAKRPAYGGQLFSHVVKAAMLEYPDWVVSEASCFFESKGETSKAIEYAVIEERKIGERIKRVRIRGTQRPVITSFVGYEDRITVVAGEVVLKLQDKRFMEIRSHSPKKEQQAYFKKTNITDVVKYELIQKSTGVVRELFNDSVSMKEGAQDGKNLSVYVMEHPRNKMKRCVCFKLDEGMADQAGKEFMEESATQMAGGPSALKEKVACLLISVLSDKHLLPTAGGYPLEDENSPNIVFSVSHRTHFADLSGFRIEEPFFYEITVEEIQNNEAYCTGQFVQNGKVFAYAYQTGILRERVKQISRL